MFVLRKMKKLAGWVIRILYRLTYKFISIDDKLYLFMEEDILIIQGLFMNR